MDRTLIKQKVKAAAIHLLGSVVLVSLVFLLVHFVWYPSPLDYATGSLSIISLLLGVDLVLGPLCTLLVFNPAKKSLKLDLLVIVVLQLAALGYGVHTLAQGRPVWLVFVVDDVEVVRAVDVQPTSTMNPEHQPQWFAAPRWVSAWYSDDPKQAQKQKEQEMFYGDSLASHPDSYRNWAAAKSKILQKCRPLSQLQQYNSLEALKAQQPFLQQSACYLPVKGFAEDQVALLDTQARVIRLVRLNPWH